MAAISYDRYNVIVNGMNGSRMTSSNWWFTYDFIIQIIELLNNCNICVF